MKFVIYMPSYEPARRLFDDFLNSNKLTVKYDLIPNVIKKLFRHHISGKLSWMPFKSFWRFIIKHFNPESDPDLIRLFIGSDYANNVIKTKFISRCKNVLFLLDINSARKLDIKLVKKYFDLIYIFDKKESEKLGVNYYPLPFSKGVVSDIAFVGQDKGRLSELISLYDFLDQNDVKCAFYIIGVEKDKQVYREGIIYGDYLDSIASLFYIINTKCVLEIKLDGVTSYSDRVQKAISYNKKILTNNPYVRESPFYRSDMIQVYDSINNIDVEFIKENLYSKSYNYIDEFSPFHFLEQIESHFIKP